MRTSKVGLFALLRFRVDRSSKRKPRGANRLNSRKASAAKQPVNDPAATGRSRSNGHLQPCGSIVSRGICHLAIGIPGEDDPWYDEIGGAEPVSVPCQPGGQHGHARRLRALWPRLPLRVVDVLGDDIVSTCQDCPRSAQPGTGLLAKYNEERQLLTPALVDLVSGTQDLTFENLDARSAPGIGLPKHAIEAIRAMPAHAQGIVVARGRSPRHAPSIRRSWCGGCC
jgi:hypothetical protein